MNQSQPEKAERIEEIVKELRAVSNMINMGEKIRWGQETTLMDRAADLLETHHQELQKTRTAERERVVGMVDGKFDEPHEGTDDVTKEQSDYWVDGYNQALIDIAEAIRGNEGKV